MLARMATSSCGRSLDDERTLLSPLELSSLFFTFFYFFSPFPLFSYSVLASFSYFFFFYYSFSVLFLLSCYFSLTIPLSLRSAFFFSFLNVFPSFLPINNLILTHSFRVTHFSRAQIAFKIYHCCSQQGTRDIEKKNRL